MKSTKHTLLMLLLALAMTAGALSMAACAKKERSLRIYFATGIADNGHDTIYQTLIPFEVVNQEGDTVRRGDVLGNVLVVDFFFASCPSVCPMMSEEMRRVHDAFAEESSLRLLSFSIDPDRDSIPVLKAYADQYGGVAGKWDFLRGEGEANRTLSQRAFYLTALHDTAADGGFQHDPRLVLLDKKGRIRGYYSALEREKVDVLIDDLRWLFAHYKRIEKK